MTYPWFESAGEMRAYQWYYRSAREVRPYQAPRRVSGCTFIYALLDDDGTPRYVGQAVCPQQRLHAHWTTRNSWRNKESRLYAWLRTRDTWPRMIILDLVSETDADYAEMRWLRRLQNRFGSSLTNYHTGFPGQGGREYRRWKAARARQKRREQSVRNLERTGYSAMIPRTWTWSGLLATVREFEQA